MTIPFRHARLLVDAPDFFKAMCDDIKAARGFVSIQCMSFEGDSAGQALGEALLAAPRLRRRLIIDAFSNHIVSGTFVHSPGSQKPKRAARAELRRTNNLIAALEADGVEVRYCNPAGLFWRRLPARNHKKSIVIDNRIAYVGGINFTEHNFDWHDLMMRIEGGAAVPFLNADFDATWNGQAAAGVHAEEGIEVTVLDGRTNTASFAPLLTRIEGARRSVLVHSPYVTFPFFGALRRAASNGARVTVLTASHNTIPAVQRYIEWECRRAGFELQQYPGMSHLKAMLIDDEALVLGSSNFDYLSYRRHQELMITITRPEIIEAFEWTVVIPDLSTSRTVVTTSRPVSDHLRHALLRATGMALSAIAL